MYIYGKNVCRERLNSNENIIKAYVSKNFKEQELINCLRDRKIRINFVDNKILYKKVSGLHQGIILEVEEFKTIALEEFFDSIKDKKNPKVVMLDHLEDPHNFGSIIRTSEALGIDGIIIPNDRSVGITPTVIKTSTGAIEHIKIIRVVNLVNAIEKLKKNGFWIIGTDMQGEDYRKIDYNMPSCLVIGNEGKGMSKVIHKNCDFIASIKMQGKINSLNASVACGIILSQMVSDIE